MIKCPTCGEEAMEGALLCKQCGTYFPTGGHLSTDPLNEEHIKTPVAFPRPSFDTVPLGSTLILRDQDNDREFVVPRKMSSALIGRNDRLAGLLVDINLADEEGKTHGISRRHARIRFVNERYLIEDLESLNGSFLNDRKLVPFIPEILHDGDTLRLGSISFSVVLKSPQQSSAEDTPALDES
jgi:hypothetical protein